MVFAAWRSVLVRHESSMSTLPEDVVPLLKALMTIESPSRHEGDVVDFLCSGLEREKWFVHHQQVPAGPGGGSGRANIYATRRPLSEHVPRLVFNSHVDTVPPYVPFRQDDVNIYGRGSCDAKGQVATMICAARRLIKDHPEIADDVALLFVVGEELDHAGMIKANELPSFNPDFLIVGEPTEMKYATIQKGVLKVRLLVSGRAGHSGYPHAGDSAIHRLVLILNDLLAAEWPKDDKLGDTNFNIGLINGGQALNAWAAKAEASVAFRVTTSYDDIKQRLERIVAGRAEFDYSMGGNDPVKLNVPPFPHEQGQAAFNTDISYYERHKDLKGVYLFGAGSITVAHGPGEFVPIEELRACIDKHVQLGLALLKGEGEE